MLKFVPRLFSVFFCAITGFSFLTAQNEVAALKASLGKTTEDSAKMRLLFALTETADDGEWQKYNEELLSITATALKKKLPESIKRKYLHYYAASLGNKALIEEEQGRPARALPFYAEAISIQKEINETEGLIINLNNLGANYQTRGLFDTAIRYYNQSLAFARKGTNKKNEATLLNNIGALFLYKGEMNKALEYYSQSLQLAEASKDKNAIALALFNLGGIYQNQGLYDNALENYKLSLKLREELDDKKDMAYSLNGIASIYKIKNDTARAMLYHRKSLKLREEAEDYAGMAQSLNNIGMLYSEAKELSKAKACFLRCRELYERIDFKQGVAHALGVLSGIAFEEKNYTESKKLATLALSMAKTIGHAETIRNSAEHLYYAGKALNEPETSLENYELYITMRDSLNNESTRKASLKNQIRYEYEKKAAADSVRIQEEKKVTAAELKAEKTQFWFLICGFAFVLAGLFLMIHRFRASQKQKKLIEQQKKLVEEKQKEILDSIQYAKRIQKALMPNEKTIDRKLRGLQFRNGKF